MRSRLVSGAVRRHHDGRAHAEDLRRRRDALGVIAGGERDHAAAALVLRDRRQLVEGAAELERAGPLQHFRFQEDPRPDALVENRGTTAAACAPRMAQPPAPPHRYPQRRPLQLGLSRSCPFVTRPWSPGASPDLGDLQVVSGGKCGSSATNSATSPSGSTGRTFKACSTKTRGRSLPAMGGGELDGRLQRKSPAPARHAVRKSSFRTPTGAVPITSRGPAPERRRPAGRWPAPRAARGRRCRSAREHEDIRRRIDLGQCLAMPRAEKHRIRKPPLQRRARRAVADDDLAAGQIECRGRLRDSSRPRRGRR